MRTKVKERTYVTAYRSRWFHLVNGYNTPKLCADSVRRAFDLGRSKRVEFRVTNNKPKRLAGWHILRKRKGGNWRLTSAIEGNSCMTFIDDASHRLDEDFPNNSTLYVCAY